MAKDTRFQVKKEQKISAIQPTDERMTGRAGLALFEAYIRSIQILPLIDRWFGSMRKNSKGLAITEGLGVYRNTVYLVFKKQPIIQRTCT